MQPCGARRCKTIHVEHWSKQETLSERLVRRSTLCQSSTDLQLQNTPHHAIENTFLNSSSGADRTSSHLYLARTPALRLLQEDGKGLGSKLRMSRSLVLKLSKSGSGIWAPNSLSLDHIWKSGFPKTYKTAYLTSVLPQPDISATFAHKRIQRTMLSKGVRS